MLILGRTGKLVIPAPVLNPVINIELSQKVVSLQTKCFTFVSKYGLTYTYKMDENCKKPDGSYQTEYILQYKQYGLITGIK